MTIFDNAERMIPYLQILVTAKKELDAALTPPENLTGEELKSFLTSCRNKALAHASGTPEAAFIGNLSEEPTVTKQELMSRKIMEDGADSLIESRDTLRALAFGLI
jgi:hypothetical protein